MGTAWSPTRGGALVLFTSGAAICVTGFALLACALVAIGGDGRGVTELALPGIASALLGGTVTARGLKRLRASLVISPVAGFAAVALAWILAAAIGALPLMLSGALDSPLDAYFEAMSGFTTTGATLIETLEPQADGILAWRSAMQWLGGIGIVVLVVAVAPISGSGLQRAFYAEASGVTSERLTPRIVTTAKIIAGIYVVLTSACAIAYLLAGMGGFDAVNHALTTIATGGFSTRTASLGAFDSTAIELVAIGFMALAGINFAFYWSAVRGRRPLPQLPEIRAYLVVLLVGTGLVWLSILLADDIRAPQTALREAAFAVTSLTTTTGYVMADFDSWNDFARLGLLLLMVVGACAGSTAGGIKVVRAMLLAKSGWQEATRQAQPSAVMVLRFGGRRFSEEVRRAVFSFFLIYTLILAAGVLALAASGLHPVTAISGAIATLNVVGPGLGAIGATENYAAFPELARAVAILLMLIGRLEIFTVVAVLAAAVRSLRGRAAPTTLRRG